MANNMALRRRANRRSATRPAAHSQSPSPARPQKNDVEDGLWNRLGGKLFFGSSAADDGHVFRHLTVLKLWLSLRAASSVWRIVHDCDEVFNYWEPLHLLRYGSGFQTWEYSPEYGIR